MNKMNKPPEARDQAVKWSLGPSISGVFQKHFLDHCVAWHYHFSIKNVVHCSVLYANAPHLSNNVFELCIIYWILFPTRMVSTIGYLMTIYIPSFDSFSPNAPYTRNVAECLHEG